MLRAISSLLFLLVLSSCTAAVKIPANVETIEEALYQDISNPKFFLSQSGSVFTGNIASISALNSYKTFTKTMYGEIHITAFPNKALECDWTIHGANADAAFQAYSTLCKGKLQRDGSFDFKGAYFSNEADLDVFDETFTLQGNMMGERIQGAIFIQSETNISFEAQLLDVQEQ